MGHIYSHTLEYYLILECMKNKWWNWETLCQEKQARHRKSDTTYFILHIDVSKLELSGCWRMGREVSNEAGERLDNRYKSTVR